MRSNFTKEPTLARIGRFVAEATIEPDRATREKVRLALIDILGCIVVGLSEDVAVRARDAVRQRSGETTVYGTQSTLAPEAAAFANAVAAHAIDFDDWETPGNSHPTAVILPAMLSACEGRRITGEAFVRAYAVGFEVIARLGQALNFEHYDAGWHTTASFGPVGASAAVARLWNLDADQSTNAVAIALSRAGGLTAQFGSDSKPLQAGFAAEGGLAAATLARAGLTGQATALDGPTGYAALTSHSNTERLEKAFAALGEPLCLSTYGLVFKPYPCCGYTHRIIDAARALRARGIAAEEIEKIEAELPDFHAAVLPFHTPANARQARFSLPFCTAIALTRGNVTAADFTPDAWQGPDVLDLVAKTTVIPFKPIRPEMNYDAAQPDRLRLYLRDGTRAVEQVPFPLGAPQAPMSADQILEKFRDNTSCQLNHPSVSALTDWPNSDDILTTLKPWS